MELSLSKLAFGCAPVMGRIGKRQALDAMAMAFERGVTHFDVARAYGFGEAERVLGRFVADKRSQVTIATKFGIQPAQLGQAARLLKPAVRVARQLVPALAGAVKKTSGAMLTKGYYSLADAQRSVETSLRELGVDVIDILFVHECAAADELSPELLDFFCRLKQQGKIKTWGVATAAREVGPVSRQLGAVPPVMQCPFESRALAAGFAGRRILHSPISMIGRLRDPSGHLPASVIAWADGEGLRGTALEQRLPILALQAAAAAAPDAVILCSMFQSKNVMNNTAAFQDMDVSRALGFGRACEIAGITAQGV
ncbi:aldo/keto reductase [Solimonas flava]|uniref:aldo/keto reductase n=1 Tax=Solimonas flava TaxID=415849 RepID=UPI0012B5881F|nr:aldo/keto reductase [Solimonas flava]